MEIIRLENQNYDNNIEMMMNDIDIHDIDNGDNGNYMMIYEAFPVSNNQFIVLF